MKCKYKLPVSLKTVAKMGTMAILLTLCFLGSAKAGIPEANGLTRTLFHSGPNFTIADFDGDLRPDFAIVEAGGTSSSESSYWIHFELSSGAKQAVTLRAPVGGIQLSSRDVNGDKIIDLVVSTTWLDRPVAVLLNDGHGNFTVSDPARFAEVFREDGLHCSYSRAEWNDTQAALPTRAHTQYSETPHDWLFKPGFSRLPVTHSEGLPRHQIENQKMGRAPPLICNHV
jgi:hypothetical protein